MKLEVSIDKQFGAFRFHTDFAVEGEHLGVFGPSGSGKSTLVHLLAGLMTPDRGIIRLDGQTLFDRGQRVDLPPEQRRMAVVFQHAHLFPHLNVRQNLLYGYQRLPASARKINPPSLYEVLNIGHLLDRGVNTLSGGERQRVALGRAVLASPRLLLMDEPLTGLEEGLKHQIMPYLKRTFTEFAIPLLFISHSMMEMRLMAEKVLLFEQGRLEGEYTTEALARQRIGSSRTGYINLLRLTAPRPHDDLWRYRWREGLDLILTEPGGPADTLVELSSKDVTLFKRHPEATSARNLLPCKVTELFTAGNRVGVELDCQGATLVAQIVSDAARELDIRVGTEVIAVIKASAFRKLY